MRLMLVVMLGVFLFGVASVGNAQTDTTARFAPHSARYSLELSANWTVRLDGVRGLGGAFVGESLAIADSEDAMRSLQAGNPSIPIEGKTMVADVFPVASATAGERYSNAEELFRMVLGEQANSATFLTINGLDAVRVDDYPGSPYSANPLAGMTMVLHNNLIYYMVYAGPDTRALEELAEIATTLLVNPVDIDNLLNTQTLGDGYQFLANRLQIPLNAGWLVLSGGTAYSGEPSYYMIVPDPNTVDYLLAPTGEADLPGAFIQVQVLPYVSLFGTSDYTPTDDDLGYVMLETLSQLGGEPELGTETVTIAGVAAQRTAITAALGGDNRGAILLLDGGDTMYSLTMIAPSATWDSLYLPLIDALFADLTLITPAPSEISIGLQVGQYAPDFTVTTLDGQTLMLSELRGQPVLLNFWATWCPPCRAEMPEFQSVYNAQSDEFVIVAINLAEETSLVQSFVSEYGLSFPIGLDPEGSINTLYGITGYPSSYVIDGTGVIRVVHVGPTNAAQVAQWLEIAQ